MILAHINTRIHASPDRETALSDAFRFIDACKLEPHERETAREHAVRVADCFFNQKKEN